MAIIGMIFGMSALTYALQAQKKIKELDLRIKKIESEIRAS